MQAVLVTEAVHIEHKSVPLVERCDADCLGLALFVLNASEEITSES